jgi:hypothetical protein
MNNLMEKGDEYLQNGLKRVRSSAISSADDWTKAIIITTIKADTN